MTAAAEAEAAADIDDSIKRKRYRVSPKNVRVLPCVDSHWQIDRDNNTTPAVYAMHISIDL